MSHILLGNHPVFRRFADITKTAYRVYFTTRQELNKWLSIRGWKESASEIWDEDSICEWNSGRNKGYIKLTENIFDEGDRLKAISSDEWDDAWLQHIGDN